jgi:hypothetical protein
MTEVKAMKRVLVVACALALGSRLRAEADVWDLASPGGDNSRTSTQNELAHGAAQIHDLAALPGPAADEDWYRVLVGRASSYELVLDGFSGELSLATTVDLVDGSGAVIATATSVGVGVAKLLAFESTSTVTSFGQYLRVHGAECGTTCDANDQYTLSFRETTYAIPRFNNSGTQRTVLILQAPHPVAVPSVSGHIYYWSSAGAPTPLATQTFTLGSQASIVVDTSAIPGLAGQAGSITISHDGPYGVLTGKAVAVEPATGFTFESPMEPRP